ncbi:MAG: hypothetical protein KC713_07515 [Candidatus Omnitrophica bacterium]|nr:hypothetical protein [Candidatus Omnitrophota bacterium]
MMFKITRTSLLLSFMLIVAQIPGVCDIVILTSGERLDGTLLQERNGIYKIKVDGIWRMIDPGQISEILTSHSQETVLEQTKQAARVTRAASTQTSNNITDHKETFATGRPLKDKIEERGEKIPESVSSEADAAPPPGLDSQQGPFFMPDFNDPQYIEMKINREDSDYHDRIKITEYINEVNLADRELHHNMIALMKDFEMAKDLSDKEMAKEVVQKRIGEIKGFMVTLRRIDEPQGAQRFKQLLAEFYDSMIVVEFAILEKFFGERSNRVPMNQYLFEMYRKGVRSFLELSRLIEDYDIAQVPDMLTRQKKMYEHYLRYHDDILNENLDIRQKTVALQQETKKLHAQLERLQEFNKQLHFETTNYLDEIIKFQQKRIKQKNDLNRYMNEL